MEHISTWAQVGPNQRVNRRATSYCHTNRPLDQQERDTPRPKKWDALRVIETARDALGLKSTSLALLRAMLSFMAPDRLGLTRVDGHICFASNARLAERIHVSITTVERHIAKLVSVGLIVRETSGNGKRWARRGRGGGVAVASGLSFRPLLERLHDLEALARNETDRRRTLDNLRATCLILLARLCDNSATIPEGEDLANHARRVLRQRPCAAALDALFRDLTHALEQEEPCTLPSKSQASDPQNEGHKDTDQDPENSSQQFAPNLPEFSDRLANVPARHYKHEMDAIALEVGLSNVWNKTKRKRPNSALLLGLVFEARHRITHTTAYFRELERAQRNGTLALVPITALEKSPPEDQEPALAGQGRNFAQAAC